MLLDRAQRSRFRIALQSGTVRRNKQKRRGLSKRPATLSPSPRAWSVTLGAVDGPIGCALIISCYFLALILGGDSLCGASFFAERGSEFLRRQHVRRGAQRSEIYHHSGDEECGSRGEKRRDPARRENDDRKTYAVGCRSRWRALRPKNSAWLATAETTASWNGLAIRNAGSGRCAGQEALRIGGDEDHRHLERARAVR